MVSIPERAWAAALEGVRSDIGMPTVPGLGVRL